MQISARSEAKRLLRVFRLSCASVGIADRKIFAHSTWQRKAEKNTEKRPSKKVRSRGTEDEPYEFSVEEQDGSRNDPGNHAGKSRVGEFAHLGTIASKLDQRNHRERQLKTQNHLAENQQRGHSVLAHYPNHQRRRNDGDRTRNQPSKPRLQPNVEKAFHHDLAGKCAGKRGVLAGGQQRAGKERAGKACSEDRAEKFVGIGDFRNVVKAARVESRGAQNENRGINKKREAERQRGIEDGESHRFTPVASGVAESTRLHDAGVEIKIVRHHCGPKDADRDVQHFAVPQDFGARDEADGRFAPKRVSEKDFVGKTSGDRTDKRHYKRFDQPEPAPLQGQHDQDIERSDDHARQKRQPEEKFQRNRGTQNLREIARGNGDFADYPEKQSSSA